MPDNNNQLGGLTFVQSNPNYKTFDLPGVIGGIQGSSYVDVNSYDGDYGLRTDYPDDIPFDTVQEKQLSNEDVYSVLKDQEDSQTYLSVDTGGTYKYEQSQEVLAQRDWGGTPSGPVGVAGVSVNTPPPPPKYLAEKATLQEAKQIETGDFEISNKLLGTNGISRAKIFSDKLNENLLKDDSVKSMVETPNIAYLSKVNTDSLASGVKKLNDGLTSLYDEMISNPDEFTNLSEKQIEEKVKNKAAEFLANGYRELGIIPPQQPSKELAPLVNSYKFMAGSEMDKIAYLANYANRNKLDAAEFVKENADQVYPSIYQTQTKLEAEAKLKELQKKPNNTPDDFSPSSFEDAFSGTLTGKTGTISDYNRRMRIVDKTVENYQKIVNTDWKNESSTRQKFSKGFSENAEQILFGTASDIRENLDYSYVLNLKNAGVPLSKEEEDYITSTGMLNYSQSLFPESRAEVVGSALPLMLNYMATFALTGGVYTGAKTAVKTGTERAVQILATKSIAKYVGVKSIEKWAPEVVGSLAGVISQATVGGAPSTVSDAVRQLTPSNLYYFDPSTATHFNQVIEAAEDNPLRAAFKAWASQNVEFGTERLGYVFGTKAYNLAVDKAYDFMFKNAAIDAISKTKLARGLGMTVSQLNKARVYTSDKLGISYLGRLFTSDAAARHAELIPTAAGTKQTGWIKKFFQATGTNNLLAENFEEFVANRIQPFIYGQEDKFWDSPEKAFKTTANEVINTSLTMAPIFGVSTTNSILSRAYTKLTSNEDRRLFNTAIRAITDYTSEEFQANAQKVESSIASSMKDITMKKGLEKLLDIRKRYENEELGSKASGQTFEEYMTERSNQSKILFEIQKSFNRVERVTQSAFIKMAKGINDKDIRKEAEKLFSFYEIYNNFVSGKEDADKYPTFYRFVSAVNEEYTHVDNKLTLALLSNSFISLPYIFNRIKNFKYYTREQRSMLMNAYEQVKQQFEQNKAIVFEQGNTQTPVQFNFDNDTVSITNNGVDWSITVAGRFGEDARVASVESIAKDISEGKLSVPLIAKLASVIKSIKVDLTREQKEFLFDVMHKHIVNQLAAKQYLTQSSLPDFYEIIDSINELYKLNVITNEDYSKYISILEKVIKTGVNSDNSLIKDASDLLAYLFFNTDNEELINIDKFLELTRSIIPEYGFEEKRVKKPYSKKSVVDRLSKAIANSKFKPESSFKELVKSNTSVASLDKELQKLLSEGAISKKTLNFIRSLLLRLPSELLDFKIKFDANDVNSFITFNPAGGATIFIGHKGAKAGSSNEKFIVYDIVEEIIHSIDFKLGKYAAASLMDEALFNQLTEGKAKLRDTLKAFKTFYSRSSYTKKQFDELEEKVLNGSATVEETETYNEYKDILSKATSMWLDKGYISIGEFNQEFNRTTIIQNLVRINQFIKAGYDLEQAYYYAAQPQEYLARHIADYLIYGENYDTKYPSSVLGELQKFFKSVKNVFLKNIVSPIFRTMFKNKNLFSYTETSREEEIKSKLLKDLMLQEDDYMFLKDLYSELSGIKNEDLITFESTTLGVKTKFGSYKWDEAKESYPTIAKLDKLLEFFIASGRIKTKDADILKRSVINNFNLDVFYVRDFYAESNQRTQYAGQYIPLTQDIVIQDKRIGKGELEGEYLIGVIMHELTHAYMRSIGDYISALISMEYTGSQVLSLGKNFKGNEVTFNLPSIKDIGLGEDEVKDLIEAYSVNFSGYVERLLKEVIPAKLKEEKYKMYEADMGEDATLKSMRATYVEFLENMLLYKWDERYSKEELEKLATYSLYLYSANTVRGTSGDLQHLTYFAQDPEELIVESFTALAVLSAREMRNDEPARNFASYFIDKERLAYNNGIGKLLNEEEYQNLLKLFEEPSKIKKNNTQPLELANKSFLSFWSKLFGDSVVTLGQYARRLNEITDGNFSAFINSERYSLDEKILQESYMGASFQQAVGDAELGFFLTSLSNIAFGKQNSRYAPYAEFEKYIESNNPNLIRDKRDRLENSISELKDGELISILSNAYMLTGFVGETFETMNVSSLSLTEETLMSFPQEGIINFKNSGATATVLYKGRHSFSGLGFHEGATEAFVESISKTKEGYDLILLESIKNYLRDKTDYITVAVNNGTGFYGRENNALADSYKNLGFKYSTDNQESGLMTLDAVDYRDWDGRRDLILVKGYLPNTKTGVNEQTNVLIELNPNLKLGADGVESFTLFSGEARAYFFKDYLVSLDNENNVTVGGVKLNSVLSRDNLLIRDSRYFSTYRGDGNPYTYYKWITENEAGFYQESSFRFGSFKNNGVFNGEVPSSLTKASVRLSEEEEFISSRNKSLTRFSRLVLHSIKNGADKKDILNKAYELFFGGYTPWLSTEKFSEAMAELSSIEDITTEEITPAKFSHNDLIENKVADILKEYLKDFGISEDTANAIVENGNQDFAPRTIDAVYRNLKGALMSSHSASLALSYAGVNVVVDSTGTESQLTRPSIREFSMTPDIVDVSSLYDIFKLKAKNKDVVLYSDVIAMIQDIKDNPKTAHLFIQYGVEIINAWKYYLSLSNKDFKKLFTSNELSSLVKTQYSATIEGYKKQIEFIDNLIKKADYRALILEIQSAKRGARARYNSRSTENIAFYLAQRKLATINPKFFFSDELIEIRNLLKETHITVANVDDFVARVEEIYETSRRMSTPDSFSVSSKASLTEVELEMLTESSNKFIKNIKLIMQERELNSDVQEFLSIDTTGMNIEELKEYISYLKFVYKNNSLDFNTFSYMSRIRAKEIANSFIESSNKKFVELFNKKAGGGIEQFFTVYGMINAYGLSDALELAQKGMSEETQILTSSILEPLNENYDKQRKVLQAILKEIRPTGVLKKKVYRNIAGIVGILSQRPESFTLSKELAEDIVKNHGVDEALALSLVGSKITEGDIYEILRKNYLAKKLKDSVKVSFLQEIEGISAEELSDMRDEMFAASMRTAKDAKKEFKEIEKLIKPLYTLSVEGEATVEQEDWFDKFLDNIIENRSLGTILFEGHEEVTEYVNKVRNVFSKIKDGLYTDSPGMAYVVKTYMGDRLFENIIDYIPLLRYKEYNVAQMTVDTVDVGSTAGTMLSDENEVFVDLSGTMAANSKSTIKRKNIVSALQTDLYEIARMRADNELFFLINQRMLPFLKSLFATRLFKEKGGVDPTFNDNAKQFLSSQIINYYNRGLNSGNIKLRKNSRKVASLGRLLRVMNAIRVLTLGSLFKAPAQLGSMFNSAQTMSGSYPERMYDISRAIKYVLSDTDGSIDRFVYDYAPDVYFRNIVDYDLDKVGSGLREKLGDLFTDYAGGKGKWVDMQMYALMYFDRHAAKIAFVANYLNFLRVNNIAFDLASPNYEGIKKAADAVKQTQGTENVLYKPATITNTTNKPFGFNVERGGEWQEFINRSYWSFKTFALFDMKRIRKARVRMHDGVVAMAEGETAAGFNMFMSGATEMIANMVAKICFAYLKALGESVPIFAAGYIAGGDEHKDVLKMHLSPENILIRSFFDYWVMLEPLQYAMIQGTKKVHQDNFDYDSPEDDYKYFSGDITSIGMVQQVWDDANVMVPMLKKAATGESEMTGIDAAVSATWLTAAAMGCYPPMSEFYQIAKTARQIETMSHPTSGSLINTTLDDKLIND